MKIMILYPFKEGPWGGANQFLKAIKDYFERVGHYERDQDKADVIFFNQYPFNNEKIYFELYRLKRKGKVMVHRIDGPFFLAKGNNFFYDKMQYKFNDLFVEGTIFQSRYSEEANKELGMRTNLYETSIYNAPNKKVFNSKGHVRKIDGKVRLVITTWSPHQNKGFDVYKWMDENLDHTKVEVLFIGNSDIKFKNIKELGPMDSPQLSRELKSCHIYLTASKNEACSNALLEALHSGLPAIVLNNGSHPELIKGAGEAFNKPEEIPALIEKISASYERYSNQDELDDIDQTGERYYNFVKKVFEGDKRKRINPLTFTVFIAQVYFYKAFLKARNGGARVKSLLTRR